YTTQCRAVMPSTWEALTSTPCLSSVPSFARSFFSAASANGAPDWAAAEPASSNNTRPAAPKRFLPIAVDSELVAIAVADQTTRLSGIVRLFPDNIPCPENGFMGLPVPTAGALPAGWQRFRGL